jgi:hypothetical protein
MVIPMVIVRLLRRPAIGGGPRSGHPYTGHFCNEVLDSKSRGSGLTKGITTLPLVLKIVTDLYTKSVVLTYTLTALWGLCIPCEKKGSGHEEGTSSRKDKVCMVRRAAHADIAGILGKRSNPSGFR